MRKSLCLAGVFLLMCLSAAAQERSTTEVFLGYTYIRAEPATPTVPAFNIHGGTAEVAFNPEFGHGWLGLVGQFGGYRAAKVAGVDTDTNLFTYMGGPQISLRAFKGVTPFAHVLFGGAHSTSNALGVSGSRNAFAMAPGAGLDFRLTRHVSFRAGPLEYLYTNFRESATGGRQTQNNLRVSTGFIWRF